MMNEGNMMAKKAKKYDDRHGGPWDRGSADSYYGRGRRPHYFAGATYQSKEHLAEEGSREYEAYMAGYDYNEKYGDKKYR